MVGGQGGDSIALSGEDHKSYAVVRPLVDKLGGDILARFEPVGLKVLRQHTRTHICGEHDVDAFCIYLFLLEHLLRAGQSDDDKTHCKVVEPDREGGDLHSPIFGQAILWKSRYPQCYLIVGGKSPAIQIDEDGDYQ